jgi:hypothetical protein
MKIDYAKVKASTIVSTNAKVTLYVGTSVEEYLNTAANMVANVEETEESINTMVNNISKLSDELYANSFDTQDSSLMYASEILSEICCKVSEYVYNFTEYEVSDVKSDRKFRDIAAAYIYVERLANDPCVDNFRVGFPKDEESMKEYENRQMQGCCGSIDILCLIDGEFAFVGCNYGH